MGTQSGMASEAVLPTSAVLTCASKHIQASYAEQTRAFTECKTAGKDPRECIAQGKALTGCALATLKQLNASESVAASSTRTPPAWTTTATSSRCAEDSRRPSRTSARACDH